MALDGHRWNAFVSAFKPAGPPKAPGAADLYGGPQAFSGYQTQESQAGQGALNTLNQIARTGWTGTDRAAFAQEQQQANAGEAAQRGALQQQAAARGQMNGGLQYAAALAAQQGGANRAAAAGAQMASEGAQRRVGAAQAAGGMEMQRGASNDAFNQFAAGMQQNAVQGAYGNQLQHYQQQQANRDKWWDRLSGFAGGLI